MEKNDIVLHALEIRQKRIERIKLEVENAYKQERAVILTDIEKIELNRVLTDALLDIEERRTMET